ncbi:glycine cleavage system aminomethyltransferase GcvT [Cellulomonas alba]|uniref:Aminomethyltransferase n=1 Tax=Cellulomonas alba TaxID=3053467 RepID=A0ABT7SFZ2_9CELL|nr:glycine cleavage system aminomethyltransferase GcvT [Cellulomonas alba]MDM7855112.1 glycine cleavage system aminomethyltransferase GcvT [Cellulomonas alba]
MTEDLRSPLHDEHVALGAALTSFAGWQMPLRYTSDIAEHTAVRTAAGLFDLSHMGELEVTGARAAEALDRALVGNLSALEPGRARYTMIVAEDGGVLDDLVVYRLAPDRFVVVANASNVTVVRAALTERFAAFLHLEAEAPEGGLGADVELVVRLRDRSLDTALIAVQGPAAEGIVTSLTPDADAVRALKYYAAVTTTVDGVDALVARTGYTGEDGFELFVDAAAAPALWRRLLEVGAPHGLVPAGLSARDSLRLEAGMPLYGNELDTGTTPYDAGLGRVVRLDKACTDGTPTPFVGRAALEARSTAEPTRALVGLVGEGRRAARHGYPVVTRDGVPVGVVTSGAPSPTLGHPVAMAYVRPDLAEPGTELGVDVRGRLENVRVVALPFYRRPR